MAQQIINVGTDANYGDGEPLRSAFIKVNANFTEVYAEILEGRDSNVVGSDSTILVDAENNKINLDGTVKGDIIPDTNVAYDIGSATKRFKDLYLSGNTINLGGTAISIESGELKLGCVKIPSQTDLDTSIADVTAGKFSFNITGDDSTVRTVQSGSNISIIGGTNTQTSSDENGNITVDVTIPATNFANLTGIALNDVQDNQVLSYNAGTGDWVNANPTGGITDLVSDTTPQLGGDLETNDKNIYFADSQEHDFGAGNADNTLFFGANGDLRMWVPLYGSIAYMQSFNSHAIRIRGDNGIQFQVGGGYELLTLNTSGSVDVKFNGNTRMQSATTGVNMTAGAFKLYNYADAAARDAVLTSPEAGMMVYITDTNKAQVYNGTSWIDLH